MGSPSVPKPPPKLPLVSSLPRAPDPTYSPIYSMTSQPPLNPPRTSTESTRPVNPRYSHFTNSPRGSPSRGIHNPYQSTTPNGTNSARESRSNSPDLPFTSTVTAHDLVDYLRKFNVLVVDVRPRNEFDSGHIYAKSIICIEPVVLKENVSAEELEERLFMSPEYEQGLFERRNEFDLVVYYDQNTASNSYLAGSPVSTSAPHLRALHDTLYEFNEYKPLKAGHPPALLIGGLDAWVDILGAQSLATSATAAVIGSIQSRRPVARPGRPLGRVPTIASANSSLETPRVHPLNSEELAAWLERSKEEEIDTSTYLEEEPLTEEPQEDSTDSQHDPSMAQIVRRYDDFLRHVPDQHHVQQSMFLHFPPNYAASVPVVPSRPPPAAPRPSYSGVSDGRFVQPHVQRQNSANRAPLYTPSSSLSRLKLPRTGLHNFGVTCYMNSTIQCLSATVTMSKFFIDDRFRYYVQKNWKGSQGVMPGLYANLIRSMWKKRCGSDHAYLVPQLLRSTKPRMQDAKEFFDFVVDCLHEDLNINWKRTPLKPLTFAQEVQRERTPIPQVSKIEWDRYSHREESFISSLFAGQHASQLRCTTCQQTSTTYEAFYSISVEIPPEWNGRHL
ncbi:ubiquitin C-terminal hydrolase [Penicillium chermesinum]|nr:ubiquitin C-terminal hydrolase [Penicillium chermesinum]